MIHTSDVEYLLKYNNIHYNRHSRSAQYMLCRAIGFSSQNSQRMKDWTLSHVALASQRLIIKNNTNLGTTNV